MIPSCGIVYHFIWIWLMIILIYKHRLHIDESDRGNMLFAGHIIFLTSESDACCFSYYKHHCVESMEHMLKTSSITIILHANPPNPRKRGRERNPLCNNTTTIECKQSNYLMAYRNSKVYYPTYNTR